MPWSIKPEKAFFHYSGHGTLIKPRNSFHIKEEEAIVPSDFNPITCVDLRHIVNRVPEGATFTILSDSCHSGGLIDKETEQIGRAEESSNIAATNYQKHKGIPSQSLLDYYTSLTGKTSTDIRTHLLQLFGEDASLMFQRGVEPLAPLKKDEGILLSGCQPNEECIDTVVVDENGRKRPCGVFSTAIQTVLKVKPGPITNRELVMLARQFLMEQNFIHLHPCLYCSDENADALFLCS